MNAVLVSERMQAEPQMAHIEKAAFLACIMTYGLCRFVRGSLIVQGLMCAIISVVIPNVFFYTVYCRRTEFAECIELVNRMTKGKLHLKKLVIKN